VESGSVVVAQQVGAGSRVRSSYHQIIDAWRKNKFVRDPNWDAAEVVRQKTDQGRRSGKHSPLTTEQVLRTFESLVEILASADSDTVRWCAIFVIQRVTAIRSLPLPIEFLERLMQVASADTHEHVMHAFGLIYEGQIRAARTERLAGRLLELNELRDARFEAVREAFKMLGGRSRRAQVDAEVRDLQRAFADKLRGKRGRTRQRIRKCHQLLETKARHDAVWSKGLREEICELEQDIAEGFPLAFVLERAMLRSREDALQKFVALERQTKRLLLLRR
jgi:hypothetical protein